MTFGRISCILYSWVKGGHARRGLDHKLISVLARLASTGAPEWVPPANRDTGAWLEPDDLVLPDDTVEYTRRDFTDAMIGSIEDDEVSHELFEELALRGEDAEELLVEEDASPDLPVPLYSTRWVRVPDHVFEQYAPLAQRRES